MASLASLANSLAGPAAARSTEMAGMSTGAGRSAPSASLLPPCAGRARASFWRSRTPQSGDKSSCSKCCCCSAQ